MFTRRHPYLFFMLLMAGMGTTALVLLAIMASIVGSDEPRLTGEKIGVIEIKGTIVDSQLILHHIKTLKLEPTTWKPQIGPGSCTYGSLLTA